MANIIPVKINDGADRDSIGSLKPSLVVRYNLVEDFSNAAIGWKKYLVRELSKVPGGMNGLTRTNNGYTNRQNPILEEK